MSDYIKPVRRDRKGRILSWKMTLNRVPTYKSKAPKKYVAEQFEMFDQFKPKQTIPK